MLHRLPVTLSLSTVCKTGPLCTGSCSSSVSPLWYPVKLKPHRAVTQTVADGMALSRYPAFTALLRPCPHRRSPDDAQRPGAASASPSRCWQAASPLRKCITYTPAGARDVPGRHGPSDSVPMTSGTANDAWLTVGTPSTDGRRGLETPRQLYKNETAAERPTDRLLPPGLAPRAKGKQRIHPGLCCARAAA